MLRAPRAGDRDLEYYPDAYARYYRAISEVTGGDVIIDSSKTATEALLLSRIGEIDLSVLHVVRDPRGVVHSWRHGWRSANAEAVGPREPTEPQSLAGIAGRWLAHNAAFEALLRGRTALYFRRRYEDLLATPRSSLTSLAPQLGLPGDAHFFRGPDVARLRETHAVEGNPGVLGTRDEISLHEDTRWKAEMPRRTRAAVTCMALPLILRYGYPLDRSIWRSG